MASDSSPRPNASRLLQWGDWEMEYDASGRLIRKWNQTTGESWSYAWNAFDQLTSVSCSPRPIPHPFAGGKHCTRL